MQRVFPVTDELALFDAAQTRGLEQREAASLEAHALMRRAGEAVARLALAVAPHARRVWVAAGPGNNGGSQTAQSILARNMAQSTSKG